VARTVLADRGGYSLLLICILANQHLKRNRPHCPACAGAIVIPATTTDKELFRAWSRIQGSLLEGLPIRAQTALHNCFDVELRGRELRVISPRGRARGLNEACAQRASITAQRLDVAESVIFVEPKLEAVEDDDPDLPAIWDEMDVPAQTVPEPPLVQSAPPTLRPGDAGYDPWRDTAALLRTAKAYQAQKRKDSDTKQEQPMTEESTAYNPTAVWPTVQAALTDCPAVSQSTAVYNHDTAVLTIHAPSAQAVDELNQVIDRITAVAGTVNGQTDTAVVIKLGGTAVPDIDPAQVWGQSLEELALQMTGATFNTWLKGSRFGRWDAEAAVLTVMCRNDYAVEWLNERLQVQVNRTVSTVSGCAVTVRFESQDNVHRTAVEESKADARKAIDEDDPETVDFPVAVGKQSFPSVDTNWTKAPDFFMKQIMPDPTVKPTVKCVLAAIIANTLGVRNSHGNHREWWPDVDYADIGRAAGVKSRTSIQNALKVCLRRGWIKRRESRKRYCYDYALRFIWDGDEWNEEA
jgi:hypothetical protein